MTPLRKGTIFYQMKNVKSSSETGSGQLCNSSICLTSHNIVLILQRFSLPGGLGHVRPLGLLPRSNDLHHRHPSRERRSVQLDGGNRRAQEVHEFSIDFLNLTEFQHLVVRHRHPVAALAYRRHQDLHQNDEEDGGTRGGLPRQVQDRTGGIIVMVLINLGKSVCQIAPFLSFI